MLVVIMTHTIIDGNSEECVFRSHGRPVIVGCDVPGGVGDESAQSSSGGSDGDDDGDGKENGI